MISFPPIVELFESLFWQVTAVSLVATLVISLLRGRLPRLAYAIGLIVVIKAVTPPIIYSPTGIFCLDWPNGKTVSTNRPVAHERLVAAAERAAQKTQRKFASSAGNPASERNVSRPVSAGERSGVFQSASNRAESNRSLRSFLVPLWACGAMVVLISAAAQWIKLRRDIFDLQDDLPQWIDQVVSQLGARMKFRRSVRVVGSKSNRGPLVFGWWTPTIVLPHAVVESLDQNQLRPIIAHEMVHVRRADTLLSLLQFVARIVWWFHPFVHWVNLQLSQACEQLCDEEVVTNCDVDARAYASSLLDVIELRQQLRLEQQLLAGAAGVGYAAATKRRLESIMKRPKQRRSRFVRQACLLLLLGLVVLPGWPAFGSQENGTKLRATADQAFATKKWKTAIRYYRQLTKANPMDGRSWFRLGYALHADGQLDKAIVAHQRASAFPRIRPIGLYNLACAYSLQKKDDLAMKTLEQAIAAGFLSRTPVLEDSDFSHLKTNKRFQQLAELAKPPGQRQVYRQFDFWVGDWDVMTAAGKKIGTNQITKNEKGFLITEKWKNANGGTGTSINYYDPVTKQWKQTWVDDGGNVIHYAGGIQSGKMVLSGKSFRARDGKQIHSRVSFTPLPDGRVRQFIEHSLDDGKTWTKYFNGFYVRRSGNGNPAS